MAKQTETTPNYRRFAEYSFGRSAFMVGLDLDDCPGNLNNNERIAWFTGWYDERINKSVGPVLKRYGQRWP